MKARSTSLIPLLVLLGFLGLAPLHAMAQDPFVVVDNLDNIPVTGALRDGGTFDGNLTIQGFSVDDETLRVTGVLNGTATTADGTITQIVDEVFTVAARLRQQGNCDILFLDIRPIFLDVLGLQLRLSRITLDIDAVPGPGNLLGNLLCAVVGLLDD